MKYLFLAYAAFAHLASGKSPGFGDDLKKSVEWIEDKSKEVTEDQIKDKFDEIEETVEDEVEDIGDIWDKYQDKEKKLEKSESLTEEEKADEDFNLFEELIGEIDKEWEKYLESQTEDQQEKDPLGLGFLDGLDETWAKEEESQEVNTIKTMNCDDFADMLEGEY